ncbi:MAG TPA: biotin/lipoyl-containing protein [Fimbriimonadaceae bacterium]|nr:biotin/lipoyl-containing protein [Fimbriimonadaceae bacterium]
MKKLVNGVEVEESQSEARVERVGDRLMVRSPNGTHSGIAVRRGDTVYISYRGRQYQIEPVKAGRASGGKEHSGELKSPLPGVVVDVLAEEGSNVTLGQKIIVLEAMKTQQFLVAPFDGRLASVRIIKGDQVAEGVLLAVVEPTEN